MNLFYQTIKQHDSLIKISALFKENSLNLTVFNNENAWKGELLRDDILKQCKNNDVDEYYANLKQYLKSCPEDVELTFLHGRFSINLLLKNTMKILFFSETLKQVSFAENILSLSDRLYNEKEKCNEELSSLKKQHLSLEKEYNNLKEKLDTFLERKNTEEHKLYGKFVTILNEKKRHIQHLNDLLLAFRRGRPTVNPPIPINKYKNGTKNGKNVKKKNIVNTVVKSDSSSSSSSGSLSDNSNYNTDTEENNTKMKTNYVSSTVTDLNVPSTSKTNFNFLDEPPISLSISKRIKTDVSQSQSSNNWSGNIDMTKRNQNSEDTVLSDNEVRNEPTPIVDYTNTQDLLDNFI